MGCASLKRNYVTLILPIILFPTLCYSQEKSKATYYNTPDSKGNPLGACGYGDYGRTINDGDVAAVSRLYNGGARCGACYKIRCLEAECNDDGVTVVVTDTGGSTVDTDFILSEQAFSKMAISDFQDMLKAYGHVDIEYQRISCEYPQNNLMLKIHDRSYYPYYLAFIFYYQGGNHDITSVDIFEEMSQNWKSCRRAYGAVWDMANPPRGNLTIRLNTSTSASANEEAEWVVADKVIPFPWRAGDVYNTSIRLS